MSEEVTPQKAVEDVKELEELATEESIVVVPETDKATLSVGSVDASKQKVWSCNIADTKMFFEILQLMDKFRQEITFTGDSDGLKARFMDSSRVVMISYELNEDGLENVEGGPSVFTIKSEPMIKFLRGWVSKSSLSIKCDPHKAIVTCVLTGETVTQTFTLPMVIDDYEMFKEPKVGYDCDIYINSKIFTQAITKAKSVTDHITFEVKERSFRLYCDLDRTEVDIQLLNSVKDGMLNLTYDKSLNTNYSADYISSFTIGNVLSEYIRVRFAQTSPIELAYILTDSDDDVIGEISMLLAPRIEEEA